MSETPPNTRVLGLNWDSEIVVKPCPYAYEGVTVELLDVTSGKTVAGHFSKDQAARTIIALWETAGLTYTDIKDLLSE